MGQDKIGFHVCFHVFTITTKYFQGSGRRDKESVGLDIAEGLPVYGRKRQHRRSMQVMISLSSPLMLWCKPL
jgi:hypothetical protein